MEKIGEEQLLQVNNFLNETEKNRIYKKLLNLIENSTEPKTQKKLKKLKTALGEGGHNKSYSLYGLDDKEMVITFAELKKLLPNMYLDKTDLYIEWLGIRQFNEVDKLGIPTNDQKFVLNVNKFLRCMINTILHEIDFDDKVDFTFSMYDRNGDGVIDKGEMEALLEHFNDYNSLNFDTETVRSIAEVLMEKLDKTGQGAITRENFREFLQEFQKKPLTFNPFVRERTFSIVVPSGSDIEGKTINMANDNFVSSTQNYDCSKPDPENYSVFCSLNSKKIIWLVIYIFLNMLVGGGSFYLWFSTAFLPVPFARTFAGLIMLNCALLLLFMCENFLTYLSNTFWAKILPLEDTKFYHSICGVVFTLAGLGHTAVHLSWTLPYIASFTDVNELNKIMRRKLDAVPTYFYLVFQSLPGWTGIVLVSLTVMMTITALPQIRKRSFELFYLLHKFYFAVFILIGFHGSMKLVVVQTYWAFIMIPAFIFSIELIIRIWRYFKYKTRILSIKFLESGVIELIIAKPPGFIFVPGHYARIQIPEISIIQWHPFTIASSPEQENIVFYISAVGWWTREVEKIGKLCNPVERKYDCNIEKKKQRPQKNENLNNIPKTIQEVMNFPFCRIDGPFGAPAQDYKNYNNLIFIASGIGATPFSSILFDFLHKLENTTSDNKIAHLHVDFYWVIRSYVSSSWLVDLFKELLRVAKLNKNCSTVLNINLIFTCSQQKYDFRSFFLWHGLELLKKERGDKVSEYCGNIFWGRPEWSVLFKNKRNKLLLNESSKKVSNAGVFVCGNYDLSKDVYMACKSNSGGPLTFDFHMENF